MRLLALASAVSVTACNQLIGVPDVHGGPCSSTAGFTQWIRVGGLEHEHGMQDAKLSHDELTIVFSRVTIIDAVPQVQHYGDLYIAHRNHIEDDFDAPTAIDAVNTEFDEFGVSLSDDLLTLYFDREDRDTQYEILAATRSTQHGSFGAPTVIQLGDDTSSYFEPYITPTAMFFSSRRPNRLPSLFKALGRGTSFAPPVSLMQVETLFAYESPVVASDGLTIYFSAVPELTTPARSIWSAQRPRSDPWFGEPRAVVALDASAPQWPTWISDDSCRLYAIAKQAGDGAQLWMGSRRNGE